jgi:chromosome segregation ATPase
MSDDTYLAITVAAIPGVLTVIAGLIGAHKERKNRLIESSEKAETLEETKQRRFDEEAERLNAVLRQDLKDVRIALENSERANENLRRRIVHLEEESDKYRNQARAMKNIAHEVRHAWANRLFVANGRLERHKLETVPKPNYEIPELEEK